MPVCVVDNFVQAYQGQSCYEGTHRILRKHNYTQSLSLPHIVSISLTIKAVWSLKGPWHCMQTWTYVVKFDKSFSSSSVWGQLMLQFITYGMNNEADRGSILWIFSTQENISLWGFTVARILRGILTNDISYFICVTGDPMIEEKRWSSWFMFQLSAWYKSRSVRTIRAL